MSMLLTGPAELAPATQFHIQIARDAQFNDLLLDTRVPARTLQVDMRQLVPGDYALRVSGIDADDFEGPAAQSGP